MNTKINTLFPNNDAIVNQYHSSFPIDQTEYLINGEIRKWNGPFQKVYSPVYFENNGTTNNYLGHYPLLNKETALVALEAAVGAYDNGRGEWPSMTIEQRINCVKQFLILMKEQRGAMVKILMWEIGKSLKDSEKEFDRTIDYVNDNRGLEKY